MRKKSSLLETQKHIDTVILLKIPLLKEESRQCGRPLSPVPEESLSADRLMVLTYSNQLDERYGEVVLVDDVVARRLLEKRQREAEQHQQGHDGEAEIEPHQAGQLRPGLYLQVACS